MKLHENGTFMVFINDNFTWSGNVLNQSFIISQIGLIGYGLSQQGKSLFINGHAPYQRLPTLSPSLV